MDAATLQKNFERSSHSTSLLTFDVVSLSIFTVSWHVIIILTVFMR